eukprot:11209564-Alexandrium_andersonii.AAC.1
MAPSTGAPHTCSTVIPISCQLDIKTRARVDAVLLPTDYADMLAPLPVSIGPRRLRAGPTGSARDVCDVR